MPYFMVRQWAIGEAAATSYRYLWPHIKSLIKWDSENAAGVNSTFDGELCNQEKAKNIKWIIHSLEAVQYAQRWQIGANTDWFTWVNKLGPQGSLKC